MNAQSQQSIERWLTQWIVDQLALEGEAIDIRKSFLSYSMNSVTAMMLVGDLEDWLGCRLPPTLAWEYPNIEALARHLAEETGQDSQTATNTIDLENAESLLNNIDGLSDEQVDSLLGELLATEKVSQ